MAKALVLAGRSFIGRHLRHELARAGHDVVATARGPWDLANSRVCDLTHAAEVAEVVAETKPDWIVQCAGATRSPDPAELYRLHVLGALHLLTAIKTSVPNAIAVFFGSAAEYGAAPAEALPLPETYRGEPADFFGASKLAQTQAVRAASGDWQLRTLIVRPSNVVGPGLPAHYLASALVDRLQHLLADSTADAELAVENGDATRDFIDVRDVARGIRMLLESAPPRRGACDVFNLATGHETSVLELARQLVELAEGSIEAVDAGSRPSRTAIRRSACSPEQAMQAIGWHPTVTLSKSLSDLWQAWPHRSDL